MPFKIINWNIKTKKQKISTNQIQKYSIWKWRTHMTQILLFTLTKNQRNKIKEEIQIKTLP